MRSSRTFPTAIDDYDWSDDHRKNIEFSYAFIRERVAKGGKGWRGYPMNDGQPLVERFEQKIAERFRVMAERIERNPQEFGGACVIVPPGGTEPIEFLLIDAKGDVAQFYGTIKSKLEIQLEELRAAQQKQQHWGR
jgi:hypothetical protein